jgi:hypothetical protein
MKHLFIPYNLALKLKEKGFDEPCLGWFRIYSETSKELVYHNHLMGEVVYDVFRHKYDLPCPLYAQATDWLREKHNLEINLYSSYVKNKKKSWWINGNDANYEEGDDYFGFHIELKELSYYEALTKAIEEALKLIK